jgi:hypothetical protein
MFLFSFAFQINYNEQMQTNFPNSPDSFLNKPLSLGEDEGEITGAHSEKSDPLNPLGEIEITHMDLPEDPTQDNFFPSNSEIITYDPKDPIFVGTIANASTERAVGEEDHRRSNITIQISESVIWSYNESATEYVVGFTPVLQAAYLERMYFNGTELDPSEYFENSTGAGNAETHNFYYDFEEDFNLKNKDEFNLTYIYNLVLPITEWTVINNEPTQYITETNQTFTQSFSYNVTFGKENSQFNTLVRLKIYLPNHKDIYDTVLNTYGNQTLPSDQYLITDDNILTFSQKMYLNETNSLGLSFKANFTVEMLEVVDGLWSEDRLIEGLNTRERDYKISITEGPADLVLKNIGINDTGIYFSHLYIVGRSGRSALNREVYIENMNKSIGLEDEIEWNETTIAPVYVDGITFLHHSESSAKEPYWLVISEIDIITIKYYAVLDLSIILMDKISTPVEGYSVKLYIGNHLYGTTINNFTIMPYPMISSDKNGAIVFRSVLAANYTIEIFDKRGNYLENATVTSLVDVNNVVTDIPHYPVTILLFTGVSAAFILIGYIIFKKNS